VAFCSASDIAALCQNILNVEDNFSTSTSPTLTEVNVWLSSGCSILETRLAAAGYSVPVATTSRAYDWLKQLNTFYGVAMAEWSRTNVITGPGERTRGQRFEEMFWNGLDTFLKSDLTQLGIDRVSSGRIYAGGTRQSDKETFESDEDRVNPRIRRGMFSFPNTLRPDRYTSTSPSNS